MCLFCRPDFISPLDDLAFDMYQDPEIAGIIRKLEKKKQEAVLRKTIFLHIKIRKQYQCYGNIIPLILILCPINIKCSLFKKNIVIHRYIWITEQKKINQLIHIKIIAFKILVSHLDVQNDP